MYEAYNYLNQKNNINVGSKNLFENYSKVLTIFSPIIPHYCSECMDDLKIKTDNKWPEVNYKLLEKQEVNIVIQINSKKRGIIVAKKDIEEEDVLKLVYKDEEIKKF